MIPDFPNFKKIELADKESINSFTNNFAPYSDFNFTNLWAWNTDNGRMISKLNDNLVVLFTDYRTAEPSLSFLGTNKPAETAHELIKHSKEKSASSVLCFISKESAEEINDSNLSVSEDENNFDYIFSVEELANQKGSRFKKKRHLSNRFLRDYPDCSFETRDFKDKDSHTQIIETLRRWENKKESDNKFCELEYEEIAINRLLNTAHHHDLVLSGIFREGEMLAFSLDEILNERYAISHFIKADFSFKGIYEFLNEKVSQHLMEQGVELWNWEQDLNIEGLRQLKMSYRPIDFLKKYRVSLSEKSASDVMLIY